MSTMIKCPQCGNEFQPDEAARDEIRKEYRTEMMSWQKKKEEELNSKLQQKEEETRKQLEEVRKNLGTQIELQVKKKLEHDYETQMKFLQQQNSENEARLADARKKELEYLKKEQEILNREKELELEMQKMLSEEKNKLSESIRKQEEERNQLKFKEYEKQLEDQKKLVEEMRRKAEQRSMQMQGEVQELALEEMLRSTFPFDIVEEVGKGVRGADCIQTVRNNLGQDCGKVIYESKRTKDFSADWIEKLKADMRSQGADIAVLVTQAMPKDMETFGEKDGIWICSFAEAKAVAQVLRDSILRVYNVTKSQENKGDKMTLLYSYLTGSEFTEQWKAIREGFMSMKVSIQKERDAMERIWKAREKQLEKILLSSAHIRGSIDGIAGMDSIDMNLLDDGVDMID
ncbi:MAG: DUF2130 domain-containing protein [Chitinophagaceae bacterium]|nr:DUF2130 domain-containing protein [Chitinophagaceae bacterium]MCB9044577.1 DUF2130 domain-containing protein [Chitinophagales bacterium]